tara:strand:+ start:161 stop:712 length:552 start_codon:yes stop_codon:yes gene_type:complete
MKKTYVIFVLIFSLVSSLLHSQEATENTENPNNFDGLFYVGIGSASGGDDENDDTTWSIGFLADMENDSILGFDIAGEGTMLDSTYGGYDDLAQGVSYNFLYGVDVSENKDNKFHVGIILGFIEEEADCPDSFLGYQCYADQPPDYEYGFNGGGFATYSLDENVNLGLRATSNSTQLTLGFKY